VERLPRGPEEPGALDCVSGTQAGIGEDAFALRREPGNLVRSSDEVIRRPGWDTIDRRVMRLRPFESVRDGEAPMGFRPTFSLSDPGEFVEQSARHIRWFIYRIERRFPDHEHIALVGGKDSQLILLSPKVSKRWHVFSAHPNHPLVSEFIRQNDLEIGRLRVVERGRLDQVLFVSEKLAATGRLAASIAHEINNPLESIQNSLYILVNRVAPDDPNYRFLEIAMKETERMSRILRQMLGFYRPQVAMDPTDVNALVEEAAQLLGKRLRDRGVRLEFRQEPLPVDSPLWGMDNVLITPHTSGPSDPYLDDPAGKVALIVRGDCTFNEKYQRAVEAGATVTPVLDEDGSTFVGSWGGGLVHERDGESRSWRNSAADPSSCLYAPNPVDSFTVVHSLSRPRRHHLYFTIYKGATETSHQLAHLDLRNNVVTCLDDNVPGNEAHAVHAFSDTLLGIATNDGLALFKTREGAMAPVLESMGVWTVAGSGNQVWALASARWGRPWAIFSTGLAYLDSLDISETRRLGFVDNFVGQNCRSLEADPLGFLWVGCDNGLFHVQTDPTGELGHVRRYGVDDGLLSLFIYDVSVDPSNGWVWVATDRGVSMFESPAHPPIPRGTLEDIVPYPNPFRPHHQHVVLDNLPSDATVRIHSPTGNIVRTLHARGPLSGRVEWDGRNESGRRVAAGVYNVTVTSGSNVVRGRIIVAR
jgi:signal transduction histidine kinase